MSLTFSMGSDKKDLALNGLVCISSCKSILDCHAEKVFLKGFRTNAKLKKLVEEVNGKTSSKLRLLVSGEILAKFS